MTQPSRTGRAKGNTGIVQGFEIFLKKQEALVQSQTEVAASMRAAADQMAHSAKASEKINTGDLVAGIVNALQFVQQANASGGGTTNVGGSAGGQPVGNRPTSTGNGRRRPRARNTPYTGDNSPSGSGGGDQDQQQGAPQGHQNRQGDQQQSQTVGRGKVIGSYGNSFHGAGGLRRSAANFLHENYGSASGSVFQEHFNPDGSHAGYMETDQLGNQILRSASDPSLKGDLASAAGRGRLSNMASGLAEGGGLKAMVGKAGVAGAVAVGAVEAVDKVTNFITDERAKNAQYQNIYGTTNFQAYGQRIQEKAFQLDQKFNGGLTGDDAKMAFQGVSSLGFQGAQRQAGLDLITSTYKKLGTDVATSLQLVTTAAQNFNTNLAGVQTGLESVVKTATQGGASGAVASAYFSQNYQAYSKTAPGAGVAGAARATSEFIGGLGTSALNNIDTSQMFSDANINVMAGQQQMTRSQFLAAGAQDSDIYTDAIASRVSSVLKNLIPADVQQYIKSQSNGQPPNQGTSNAIALDIMQKFPNINGKALAAAFANLGIRSPDGGLLDDISAVTLAVYSILKGNFGKTNDDKYKQDTGNKDNPDPVLTMASQTLGNDKKVTVKTSDGYQVMNLGAAIQAAPDQIAKGTAVVTDTGETIKATLGGAAEENYQGKDTTNLSAKEIEESAKRAVMSTASTDPVLRNKLSMYGFDGMQSLDEYNKETAQTNSGTGVGGKGNITISATPELQRYFNFDGSGDVLSANASGVPTKPR